MQSSRLRRFFQSRLRSAASEKKKKRTSIWVAKCIHITPAMPGVVVVVVVVLSARTHVCKVSQCKLKAKQSTADQNRAEQWYEQW